MHLQILTFSIVLGSPSIVHSIGTWSNSWAQDHLLRKKLRIPSVVLSDESTPQSMPICIKTITPKIKDCVHAVGIPNAVSGKQVFLNACLVALPTHQSVKQRSSSDELDV